MAMSTFSWDSVKERMNSEKHGVSFQEARSVFSDEQALLIFDPDHSEAEDRYILLGISNALRLLVVFHCYRKNEDQI